MNNNTTITVSRNTLLQAIEQTAPARATRTAWDIFKCFIFEIQDGKLYIMAADGEFITAHKHVPAEIKTSCQERQVYPVCGTLRTALRQLDDQPLRIFFGHSQIVVEHEFGRFFMPIERMEESFPFSATFPKKEDARNAVTIEVPDMRRFLYNTIFCMADDELRPVMNGICFEFKDDHMALASSDGHMLATVDAWSVPVDFKDTFIMNKKTAVVLHRVMPKAGIIELSIHDKHVRMDIDDGQSGILTIVSRVIDGRYPNYLAVIPQDNALAVTANRKQLLAAVRRADLFANYSSKALAFYLVAGGDDMEIKADDTEYEMGATERVPASYGSIPLNKWSPNFRIGFKSTPLSKILTHMKDNTIVINAKDGSRAITIVPAQQTTDDKTLYLLMPMLIND